MSTHTSAASSHPYELTLDIVIRAPKAAIWRCWTEPDLLKKWFCPKPWSVTEVDMDLRVGGLFRTKMQGPGPDGQIMTQDGPGVFLEVISQEKLVFTDAFTPGWIPVGKPFMVAEVILLDGPSDGTTHYIAKARHWNAEDYEAHEKMGFHEGWKAAADQLEVLAQQIAAT